MSKAISYTRISNKDQSNFSIIGQADIITTYCTKNKIELIATFTDEGESAKNFDRTDWKDLEQFVKKNHTDVNMLIVAKYDRFSRNLSEALQMIELLEKRFNIRVVSVMEPIDLHPDSPYYYKFRTDILQGADVELRIIRDRTKFGMQQAAKSGRYITMAPYGYKNERDERNKPIIVQDPVKAPAVARAFERFLRGDSLESIRKDLKLQGKSSLPILLQRPVYMGYVKKPAYYDEPERLIKGIHEAIVSEDTWWKVQALFNQSKKPIRTTLSEEFPLRGILKCFCGRCLTAANSKGKKILVGYYKCNGHTKFNLNAKKLHSQFDQVLQHLSLSDIHIRYLQEKVMTNIQEKLCVNVKESEQKQQQLSALLKKIDNLEEKFLNNDIDKQTFQKWKMRYYTEKDIVSQALQDLARPTDDIWKQYAEGSQHLADVQLLYNAGTVSQKQAFVRMVFNNSLYYQAGIYRTPFILDLFRPKVPVLKEKGLLEYEQPLQEMGNSYRSSGDGTSVEPLFRFFSLLNDIKTA